MERESIKFVGVTVAHRITLNPEEAAILHDCLKPGSSLYQDPAVREAAMTSPNSDGSLTYIEVPLYNSGASKLIEKEITHYHTSSGNNSHI